MMIEVLKSLTQLQEEEEIKIDTLERVRNLSGLSGVGV
jgi:hypothetical protein